MGLGKKLCHPKRGTSAPCLTVIYIPLKGVLRYLIDFIHRIRVVPTSYFIKEIRIQRQCIGIDKLCHSAFSCRGSKRLLTYYGCCFQELSTVAQMFGLFIAISVYGDRH